MGLEKMICDNCKTVYYGNIESVEYDGMCFMCSQIRGFLGMFNLNDLGINEVDFYRVREPKFEEMTKNASSKDMKDWRRYIPEGLKAIWQRLPIESRALAVMFAEREARAIVEVMGKC